MYHYVCYYVRIKLTYKFMFKSIAKYKQTLAYGFVIAFFTIDVVIEFSNDETGLDFYLESLFILILFFMLYQQLAEIKSTSEKLNIAEDRLDLLQLEIDHVVNQKLSLWSLTKAEQNIAWMLIKGHSFKEIASTRNVTESTVYRQTANIYAKANVKSLHEFTSIFLDSLINAAQNKPSKDSS